MQRRSQAWRDRASTDAIPSASRVVNGQRARSRWVALCVVVIAVATARDAHAHDVRGEVIFLDVGDRVVDVELCVPVFQLALARSQSIEALLATPIDPLAADARAYVALRDRQGAAFAREIRSISVQEQHGAQVMVFALRFTPPPGATARWFELADDLVLRSVVNANIYVFVRRDLQGAALGDSPTLVGTMHYQQRRLVVDRTAGNACTGVAAAFALGLDHIREGTDHLLFLLMLLVVAPLACGRATWTTATTARRGVSRTIRIATAFTLGHSLTLALGAVGGVVLPARWVESAIAVSILVSAIHAWRPMFPGRESWVAAGFGLVHGLAFATALAGFGFDRPSLLIALAGFNLGVEAMQLIAIALTMPSLIVLARHRPYTVVRRVAAVVAAIAALAWLSERLLGAATPLSPLLDRVAGGALWIPIALFALAISAFVLPSLRRGLRRPLTLEEPS